MSRSHPGSWNADGVWELPVDGLATKTAQRCDRAIRPGPGHETQTPVQAKAQRHSLSMGGDKVDHVGALHRVRRPCPSDQLASTRRQASPLTHQRRSDLRKPIPQLSTLLDELGTRPRRNGVDTVLVNSFGQSWSGDGFGGVSFRESSPLALRSCFSLPPHMAVLSLEERAAYPLPHGEGARPASIIIATACGASQLMYSCNFK